MLKIVNNVQNLSHLSRALERCAANQMKWNLVAAAQLGAWCLCLCSSHVYSAALVHKHYQWNWVLALKFCFISSAQYRSGALDKCNRLCTLTTYCILRENITTIRDHIPLCRKRGMFWFGSCSHSSVRKSCHRISDCTKTNIFSCTPASCKYSMPTIHTEQCLAVKWSCLSVPKFVEFFITAGQLYRD